MVCNENCQTKIDEKLNERFFNIFKCSIHDNNKFILLLIKGVCSYKYMDDWKKFSKSTLSEKEDFYSLLNMEGITNADYANAKKKRVCKDFETKHLREYHDLYAQSNTSLLADVFENFRNMCINIYELDPAKFLSAPGLAWQHALQNTEVKLDLLTDINMLLIVKKVKEEEYVILFVDMLKLIINI